MTRLPAAFSSRAVSDFYAVFVLMVVVAGGVAIWAGPASAVVTERVKKACKSDYYRHCPSYAIGTPQLRTCMTKAGKRKQLGHGCLRALIDAGEVPRKYLKKR